MIGPFRGGRVVAVTGVPGDGAMFYFGSVGGGIWKTTDAGVTWTPIFDCQPIASIGALEVAPSDPKILYAGTGESDIRSIPQLRRRCLQINRRRRNVEEHWSARLQADQPHRD